MQLQFSNLRWQLLATLIVALMTCASQTASAQAPRKITPSQKEWMQEPWTGNEQPFRRARREVKERIRIGMKPEDIATVFDKYLFAAIRAPLDPVAQFTQGYAAFRQVQINQWLHYGGMGPALEAMTRVPSPHTYEFSRLRFILAMMVYPSTALKPMGLRLLKHKPDDTEVMYLQVRALNYQNPAERDQGLSLANRLVQKLPKQPNVYALLGQAYYRAWLYTGNRIYGDRSIQAYRKHIGMMKVDAIGQRQINLIITKIQSGRR